MARVFPVLGCCLGLTLVVSSTLAQQPLTIEQQLRRITDLDRLSQPPPAGEKSLLFSSFDRASKTVEGGKYVKWDAGADENQFLGKSEDGWDIWARVEGPGIVTRLFADRTAAGELRISIDGRTAVEAKLSDFFGGAVEPLGEPLTYVVSKDGAGVNHFPIGFSKSCVIASRGFAGAYQADVSALPAASVVQAFSKELDEGAQKAVQQVAAAFRGGLTEKQIFSGKRMSSLAIQPDNPLGPGAKLSEKYEKPGTIRALYISLTDRLEPRELHALHNIVLRIRWDDRKTPDVEAPLADFFGSGFERRPYRSMLMGTDHLLNMPFEHPNEDWFMYCHFPMPFHKGFTLEVENRNDARKGIGLMVFARIDLAAPDRAAMHFHARFRKEAPCKRFDYPILECDGPGRFVGAVLSVDVPRGEWWAAGDHKAWIDGENFPSMFGTSTADYFGNGRPLIAAPRALSGATSVSAIGKNSLYRWHTSDAIEFHKSIRLAIENAQPGKQEDVTYSSVAYWYATPAAGDKFESITKADLELPGLRIPGAIEIEGRIAGTDWGQVAKQRDETGVEYSGKAAARIITTEKCTVGLPIEKAGKYNVKLRVVPGGSFESIEVGTPDGKPVASLKYDRKLGGMYVVGTLDLAAGDNQFTLQTSRSVLLDCWVIEPAAP